MYWDGHHPHHVPAHRQPNQSAVSAKLKDASLIHIVIFRGANSGTLSGGGQLELLSIVLSICLLVYGTDDRCEGDSIKLKISNISILWCAL